MQHVADHIEKFLSDRGVQLAPGEAAALTSEVTQEVVAETAAEIAAETAIEVAAEFATHGPPTT